MSVERIVAVAEAHGPQTGRDNVDHPALIDYRFLHATSLRS